MWVLPSVGCPAAWENLAQPGLNINRTWKIKSPVNTIAIAQGTSQLVVMSGGVASLAISWLSLESNSITLEIQPMAENNVFFLN